MKTWIRRLARLYPAAWRRRYGSEFDALLEDASTRWRDLFDVMRGALEMHIETWSFRKIVLAFGLAGAIIAAAVAFRIPDKYVSTVHIRVGFGRPDIESKEHITQLLNQALSRKSLAELTRKANLYPAERQRKPLENVLLQMRNDIRMYPLDNHAGFALQYAYRDPARAQKTLADIIVKMFETAVNERPTVGVKLAVLDAPDLPHSPASPNRMLITAIGLCAGLLLAGLAAVATRLRHRS